MSGFDRDQLDALRRQVEEDFRLDMAAIERLQRRYSITVGNLPASPATGNYAQPPANYPAPSNGANGDARGAALPPLNPSSDPQDKELSGALRSMFKSAQGR